MIHYMNNYYYEGGLLVTFMSIVRSSLCDTFQSFKSFTFSVSLLDSWSVNITKKKTPKE